jgi:hypothetical protein
MKIPVMKNLGKCTMMIVLAMAMLILVTQQYRLVNWTDMSIEGLANEYYAMTTATVDDQGNTIIKTMDTNGFFDLGISKRSSFVKT